MDDRFIIAIGSSAGGLVALKEFFDAVPHDQASYVILRHIPVSFRSELHKILKRHSKLDIIEVEDGMKISKDIVYIPPPYANLSIKNSTFYLHKRENEFNGNWAIDFFLESLAREARGKCIAVILSGAGSDGSKGIEHIKNSGGSIIVQKPVSCEHTGMPISAIDSGFVDFVLLPSEMPGMIQQVVTNVLKTSNMLSNLKTAGLQ